MYAPCPRSRTVLRPRSRSAAQTDECRSRLAEPVVVSRSALRLDGATDIAAADRHHAHDRRETHAPSNRLNDFTPRPLV